MDRKYLHAVGATLVAGAATYVFLGIVSRNLADADFDTFSVYWSLSLIVGFGLFLPIEQELSRLSAAGTAPGRAGRAALLAGLEISVAILVLVGLATPLLLAAGIPAMTIAVAAAFVPVSAVQFAARGTMLVSGRIAAYANVLIADSVLRVLVAALLALAAIIAAPSASGFAVGLIAAILIAHFLPLRSVFAGGTSDPALRTAVRNAVLGLIAGSLAAQLLLNAGPILIAALGAGAGEAGAFQASFSLARIPLFMLVPLQGVLVAPLAAQVARGETHLMTRTMLRLAALVLIGAVVGAGAAYLLGPWVVELVFGPGRSLSAVAIALLVGGVGGHCGLVIGIQALVATEGHRRATITWLVAAVTFVVIFAAVSAAAGPVVGSVVGFAVSSVVGWIVALLYLAAAGRASRAPDPNAPQEV